MERSGDNLVPLTHEQLSAMLGVGRSYTSRVIQTFKADAFDANAFVAPPADATAVTVERDGVALATAPVVDGVAALPDVELGAGGWHALTIRAGAATRVVPYNLLQISDRSWAADIEPIFAASCAGGRCHGPSPSGGRIDLSTYDGWRQKASRVRERLLRGEMPPSGPPLDSATIDVVIDWIEGGMRP